MVHAHWLGRRAFLTGAGTMLCGSRAYGQANTTFGVWRQAVLEHRPGAFDESALLAARFLRADFERLLRDFTRPVEPASPDCVRRALVLHTDVAVLSLRQGGYALPETGRSYSLLADAGVSDAFGRHRRKGGRIVDLRGTQVAGIALARRATIATRNVTHFADLAAPVVDPWTADGRRR